jgi:hypothetical protein
MNHFSTRRLKENEVIFREVNESIAKFIEKETDKSGQLIDFYCECSNSNCRQRVGLTAKQYGRLHSNRRRFIVVPGHEMPEVEKVIESESNYRIVEKFGEMPTAKEIDMALPELAG